MRAVAVRCAARPGCVFSSASSHCWPLGELAPRRGTAVPATRRRAFVSVRLAVSGRGVPGDSGITPTPTRRSPRRAGGAASATAPRARPGASHGVLIDEAFSLGVAAGVQFAALLRPAPRPRAGRSRAASRPACSGSAVPRRAARRRPGWRRQYAPVHQRPACLASASGASPFRFTSHCFSSPASRSSSRRTSAFVRRACPDVSPKPAKTPAMPRSARPGRGRGGLVQRGGLEGAPAPRRPARGGPADSSKPGQASRRRAGLRRAWRAPRRRRGGRLPRLIGERPQPAGQAQAARAGGDGFERSRRRRGSAVRARRVAGQALQGAVQGGRRRRRRTGRAGRGGRTGAAARRRARSCRCRGGPGSGRRRAWPGRGRRPGAGSRRGRSRRGRTRRARAVRGGRGRRGRRAGRPEAIGAGPRGGATEPSKRTPCCAGQFDHLLPLLGRGLRVPRFPERLGRTRRTIIGDSGEARGGAARRLGRRCRARPIPLRHRVPSVAFRPRASGTAARPACPSPVTSAGGRRRCRLTSIMRSLRPLCACFDFFVSAPFTGCPVPRRWRAQASLPHGGTSRATWGIDLHRTTGKVAGATRKVSLMLRKNVGRFARGCRRIWQ